MLEGILRMKEVLNALREMPSEGDLTLIDLKKKIPSRNQMFTYEKLFPILDEIRDQSEFLSSDTEPSSCHVVPILYHIKEKINEVKPYLIIRICVVIVSLLNIMITLFKFYFFSKMNAYSPNSRNSLTFLFNLLSEMHRA
jgi:hypothetical protein